MTEYDHDDLTPDPRLRDALRLVDRAPTLDVDALRVRILASAAPRLALRRTPELSWWDVTSRAGRFLVPASLAAAALAILLLRQAPLPTEHLDVAAAEITNAVAYDFSSDTADLQRLAADELMPADADSWLLGDPSR
jgi:anti-sigma-K factor RskA